MLKKIITVLVLLSICIGGYILYKSYFVGEEVVENTLPDVVKETTQTEMKVINKDILDSKYKSTGEVGGGDTY